MEKKEIEHKKIKIALSMLLAIFFHILAANNNPPATGSFIPMRSQFDGDLPPAEIQSFDNTVEEKIRASFPEEPDVAIAIAKAESNMKSWKIGDKHLRWKDGRNGMSCGLFQIRIFPKRPNCEKLLDEDFNIEFARKLYEKSGWKPWSTYTSGIYKKFMG